MSRPYIPVQELSDQGFIQEANRLFFHPCGLALERRIITNGWSPDEVDGSEWMQARIFDIFEALRKSCPERFMVADGSAVDGDALNEAALAVCQALWPNGSTHLSGVQDLRDDPEGLVFGADPVDKIQKAATVRNERMRRWQARSKLWNGGPLEISTPSDVEPLGWVAPPGLFDE